MNTSTPFTAVPRPVAALLAAFALSAALFLSGCATIVKVESSPPGAAVTIGGKSLGVTPTQWQVENAAKPVEVNFSLPGYFPENITYTAGGTPAPIYATLEPTKLAKSFEIATEPVGATVMLNNRQVGTAPLTLPVEFGRNNKNAPWTPQRVTLSKTNYETETVTLTSTLASVPVVELSLLKDERVYAISASTLDGAALKDAEVKLDGKPVGKTPFNLPITYLRTDKTKPWPKFTVTVDMPGLYKSATAELTYARDTKVALKLDAITEINVTINSPQVDLTDVGAVYKFKKRETIATLRTGDSSTAITDLKQVTGLPRQDSLDVPLRKRLEAISSFAITSDGRNVIFAMTSMDEKGEPICSNLYMKKTDDPSSGVTTLAADNRALDAQPFIAKDEGTTEGSSALVFTSNRYDRRKPDVCFVKNPLSGAFSISRLTNDNRFNYQPTYGDSNRQLFFLSMEPDFTKAKPQVSSIKFDGTLPTQLQIVGDEIGHLHANKNAEKDGDRLLFVKRDPDTKKQQIFSSTAEGKLETALSNRQDFKNFNCFQPYLTFDGQRVLFVSDHTTDPKDRPNSDLYIINTDGTNLQRLTTNESDDLMPIPSPTEEGVVYFLSTRGGATNIWRFKLASGR